MTTANLPTSLASALDFTITDATTSLKPSNDIVIGTVSHGGYIACVLTKCAVLYARKHPKTVRQTDVRSTTIHFYRPVLPLKLVDLRVYEASLGKAWSTLRVELFQNDKIAASADVIICSFSLPSFTLQTHWKLSPPPRRVHLSKLEMGLDPDWVSYQPAFHPDGFRRGHSYAKIFIPKCHPLDFASTEQWICPGWDCLPLGSCAATEEQDKARWTTDMIQFAIDSTLPVQENLFPRQPGQLLPMGSVAAALAFATEQKKARDDGKTDWRPLANDGSRTIIHQAVHATLSMTTEIKKTLPLEGRRWLYARAEAKSIVNGRLDTQVLLFDEEMDLVAISNQVSQIIPAAQKVTQTKEKRAQL
ncbi:hypothetical protein HIM_00198 [Hirsutella minnesotensis 3608]|nr:hypothetical protein HIM_00198 [Hirsutella minnesotensis 3608]